LSYDLDLSPQQSENFGNIAARQQVIKTSQQQRDSRFTNQELESRTNQIQEEFERMMEELNRKRVERDGDAFYVAMNDYNYGDADGGHE
jgi:hypothetical protein